MIRFFSSSIVFFIVLVMGSSAAMAGGFGSKFGITKTNAPCASHYNCNKLFMELPQVLATRCDYGQCAIYWGECTQGVDGWAGVWNDTARKCDYHPIVPEQIFCTEDSECGVGGGVGLVGDAQLSFTNKCQLLPYANPWVKIGVCVPVAEDAVCCQWGQDPDGFCYEQSPTCDPEEDTCDDGDPCTFDACMPESPSADEFGCATSSKPEGYPCGDNGGVCNNVGVCQVSCVVPADCPEADGSENTCDEETGDFVALSRTCINGVCGYVPITQSCGTIGCTNEGCLEDPDGAGVSCTPGLSSCNDGDPCTTDSCHEDLLTCQHEAISDCRECSSWEDCDFPSFCSGNTELHPSFSCHNNMCVQVGMGVSYSGIPPCAP